VRPSLLAVLISEIESWLQKQGEDVDDVLRTVQVGDLSLILLVLPFIHSSFVTNLFISKHPHFFRVAVFSVESIRRLEESIPGKLFCKFAVVLLLKVHKGLLGSWNDLDFGDFTTVAC
jgi:hypothetical protein